MKKNFLSWFVLLSIIGVSPFSKLQGGDLPGLRVSDNGRFLVQQDGTVFFPVADTAWAIAWKLNRSQVETYLQHRKEQKFNTIAIIAFPSYEDRKVEANRGGDHPFEMSKSVYDPLRPITTAGNNPANSIEYDYWDHLEYIIDTSAKKGMYVVLLPTWGGHIAGGYGNGKENPGIILRLPGAYQYGHWIGQRFKKKKNIIWMLGGDRSAVYGKRDYRDVFETLAEGIADGVNGVNQKDGKADFSTTMMSYHPQKWAPNSSQWFHNSAWLDFNSIQDQPRDQIIATELDYSLTPTRPTWLFEGGYEHRRNIYKDWQIRFQSYQTVFAGGFGITYGNMNIYHFSDESDEKVHLDEPVEPRENGKWKNSMDDPGSRQMRHLWELMTSFTREQFLNRIPDQSLIEGDQGKMDGAEGDRSSRIQATRGKNGNYAMIYSANGRNISIKMNRLSASRKNAFWFNPRNGKWWSQTEESADAKPFMKNIPSGPTASVQQFDPPGAVGDGNDWVLLLK